VKRLSSFVLLLAVGLGLGAGCQERTGEAPPTKRAAVTAPVPEPLLRWHFVGAAHLAGDPNAAKLRQIAALPSTLALRTQTLQKLSVGLANSFPTSAGENTNRAALLRPLLEDVWSAETFFQWHALTNGTGSWTLAIDLDNERARFWQTNLAQCFAGPDAPQPFTVEKYSGFRAGKHHWLRAGRWLLVAASGDERPWLDTLHQLTASSPPSAVKDAWLEVEADLPVLAARLGWTDFITWPRAQMTVSGKGEDLRSNVRLHYPRPLNLPLDAWRVPTNTIQDPLISFTAVRGVAPGLKQKEFIQRLAVEPVPNQIFLWAQADVPFQSFAAWPAPDATNHLTQLAPRLVAWAKTNANRPAVGEVLRLTNTLEVAWQGLPIIVPSLHPAPEPAGDFMMAGIFPSAPSNQPLPPELLGQLTQRTNLVYYDWEITGARLLQWRQLDQVLSMLTPDQLPQFPGLAAGPPWLAAISPLLGNSVTEVMLTSPQELTLVRKSHFGLTGFELVALVKWLDDPGFPTAGLPGSMANPKAPELVPPKP
jgi:hypothetical protein